MSRPKKNGIYDYKEKNGKYSYYVKVVYVRGLNNVHKRKPIRARTIPELQEKVSKVLEEAGEGNVLNNLTVGQWCDHWKDKILPGTVKDSTLNYYKFMLGYLNEDIRRKRLSKLTVFELQSFFLALREHGSKQTGKQLSTTTVRSVRATLITVLDAAIDNGFLSTNVVKKTKPLIQSDKKEISYLTNDEMLRLMAVADSGEYYGDLEKVKQDIEKVQRITNKTKKDINKEKRDQGILYLIKQWSVVIRLILATGMRRGEIFGITWDCVDFLNNSVMVRRNLQGGRLESPKTPNSIRTICVDADTMQKLKSWKEYQSRYGAEVGDLFINEMDLVFTNSFGRPVDFNNFRCRYFNKMVIKAGLSKKITLHGCRHSNATAMLACCKTDLRTVSQRLGHASGGVAFTLKTYTHALQETDRAAADAIGKILSGKKEDEDK